MTLSTATLKSVGDTRLRCVVLLVAGRPVCGIYYVLAPLAGGSRTYPKLYTGEGPRRILPLSLGGILDPQCNMPYLGPGIPVRGGLGIYWRDLEQSSTPLWLPLSLFWP